MPRKVSVIELNLLLKTRMHTLVHAQLLNYSKQNRGILTTFSHARTIDSTKILRRMQYIGSQTF